MAVLFKEVASVFDNLRRGRRVDKVFDVPEMRQDLEVGLEAVPALEGPERAAELRRKDRRINGSVQRSEIRVEEDAVSDPFVQKRSDELKKILRPTSSTFPSLDSLTFSSTAKALTYTYPNLT